MIFISMLLKNKLLMLTLFLMLACSISAYGHILDNHKLTYVNLRGTIISVEGSKSSKNSGMISGMLKSKIASIKCPQAYGKNFPIVGYYVGDTFSAAIVIPVCKQVIGVIGNFDENKNIDAMWISCEKSNRSNTKDCNTRVIGHDYLKLIKIN